MHSKSVRKLPLSHAKSTVKSAESPRYASEFVMIIDMKFIGGDILQYIILFVQISGYFSIE
ncbi:MAG: hypothetical protein A2854_02270 [Parcubacteria group bacterium RIFCSPHIGHO2_01_FULL_56_18]|nr:MAG: hypothetical protein A2854_02270 [Parcubacteria group bacterium RIFCSPHIGHO2_01_FULL_56_18]